MEKQIREIIAQNVGGTYEAKQKCAEEILRFATEHNLLVEGSDCGDSDEEQMAREQAENDEMNDQAQFEAEQNAQGQAEADNAQHEGEW